MNISLVGGGESFEEGLRRRAKEEEARSRAAFTELVEQLKREMEEEPEAMYEPF